MLTSTREVATAEVCFLYMDSLSEDLLFSVHQLASL